MAAQNGQKVGSLDSLQAGMKVPFGGSKFAVVDDALARKFQAGDRLYVVQATGALRRVPAEVADVVTQTVDAAVDAARLLRGTPVAQVRDFYLKFAETLAASWSHVEAANAEDVARAVELGRSTTRLEVNSKMRDDMIAGLRGWAEEIAGSAELGVKDVETIDHGDWNVQVKTAPLGVIGFVFEGRPNVFADSAGVLATGNSAVLRIGGDALATAQAILDHALRPALQATGLPQGAISLVPSRERSAGWALFSDTRLSLAVVRGSGSAVTELSSIAQQAGIPVSAHGTGGAWMIADRSANAERYAAVVSASLDRKVCNTLNVAAIVRERAEELVPIFLAAADNAAQERGGVARVHVVDSSAKYVDSSEFEREISVVRPDGPATEKRASHLPENRLGEEWEWEETPEITLVIVDGIDHAADLFNTYSPQFVATLIAEDDDAHAQFREPVNAPFVGDGFTRWVDGQYALGQTELGLANWERGRLLARSGVLTGADLTARRLFAHHSNHNQHR